MPPDLRDEELSSHQMRTSADKLPLFHYMLMRDPQPLGPIFTLCLTIALSFFAPLLPPEGSTVLSDHSVASHKEHWYNHCNERLRKELLAVIHILLPSAGDHILVAAIDLHLFPVVDTYVNAVQDGHSESIVVHFLCKRDVETYPVPRLTLGGVRVLIVAPKKRFHRLARTKSRSPTRRKRG